MSFDDLDLFSGDHVGDAIQGSLFDHCQPPAPPPPPFIDAILNETKSCWPCWSPVIGDGFNGFMSAHQICGEILETGETTYIYMMPMKILEINPVDRFVIAVGAYCSDRNEHLAEIHNDTKYKMYLNDIWPPTGIISEVQRAIEHGFPLSWAPPAGFDSWRLAMPSRYRNEFDDCLSRPEFAIGDRCCILCKDGNVEATCDHRWSEKHWTKKAYAKRKKESNKK